MQRLQSAWPISRSRHAHRIDDRPSCAHRTLADSSRMGAVAVGEALASIGSRTPLSRIEHFAGLARCPLAASLRLCEPCVSLPGWRSRRHASRRPGPCQIGCSSATAASATARIARSCSSSVPTSPTGARVRLGARWRRAHAADSSVVFDISVAFVENLVDASLAITLSAYGLVNINITKKCVPDRERR